MTNYKIFLLICVGLVAGRIARPQDRPTIHSIIHFLSGSAVLDTTATRQLNGFIKATDSVALIVGYADTIGTLSANLRLSRKRAENVFGFLKGKGIVILQGPGYKGEVAMADVPLSECRVVQLEGFIKIKAETVGKRTITEKIEIPFNNIYFRPDQAILAPESVPYVERMAKYLKGIAGRILIVGHINYQTSRMLTDSASLFKLSEQRAKLIFDLFTKSGIDPQIMNYKGVGNSEPVIVRPATEEEKRRNMRVQLFLLPL